MSTQSLEPVINIKGIVGYLRTKYLYILLAIPVGLITGYIASKTMKSKFHPSVLVQIGDQNASKQELLSGVTALGGLGIGGSGNIQLEEFKTLVASEYYATKVINQLGWEVVYYSDDILRKQELDASEAPFEIVIDKYSPQLVNTFFEITILDNGQVEVSATIDQDKVSTFDFTNERYVYLSSELIEESAQDFETTVRFGDMIDHPLFRFRLVQHRLVQSKDPYFDHKQFFFMIKDPFNYGRQLASAVKVEPADGSGSIVEFGIKTGSRAKSLSFIKQSYHIYEKEKKEYKNQLQDRSLEFLYQESDKARDTLNKYQTILTKYSEQNKILDLELEGEAVLKNIEVTEREREEVKLNLSYIEGVIKSLEGDSEGDSTFRMPSTSIIEDNNFNALLGQYINLNIKKQSFAQTVKKNNPYLESINSRLQILKEYLIQSANSIREDIELKMSDINKRLNEYERGLVDLPQSIQDLVVIKRKLTVAETQLLFLYKTIVNNKLNKGLDISPSRLIGDIKDRYNNPTSSPPVMILGVFLIATVVIVVLLLVVRFIASNKLFSHFQLLDYPLIGVLKRKKNHSDVDIQSQFASIRYQLVDYVNQNHGDIPAMKVISILSASPSEGKTYLTNHLAHSFGFAQKKVLVVEVKDTSAESITNFSQPQPVAMINHQDVDINTYIQKSEGSNYDHLVVGIEDDGLLLSDKFNDMILAHKANYDFVFIEIPNTGLGRVPHVPPTNEIKIVVVRRNKSTLSFIRSVLSPHTLLVYNQA